MRTARRSSRWPAALLAAGLAGCGAPPIPVVEPGPPPTAAPLAPPSSPQAVAPPRAEIGRFPEAPAPRFGIAVFVPPREGGGPPAYSGEWTNVLVNRLELHRVAARAVPREGQSLEGDLERAAASVAAHVPPGTCDVLVAGTVAPSGTVQARLVSLDLGAGPPRLVARSEFEGDDVDAVIGKALEDALDETRRWWFERHRGQDAEVRVEARGLRAQEDIARLHEALAAVPGVHLVRHAATAVPLGGGAATAGFQVFFHGPAEIFLTRAAQASWRSGGRAARLRHVGAGAFEAAYE
ncbi:MAG: hypothetical protein HY721_24680 [Planctomycetes bacterium]|nr:hypothetical protein [Planctomycetota bacterium]